jgi:hypothetical protein
VAKDSLTVTDNRTGKQYEIPIAEGTIKAADLKQIKVADDDFGLMAYDPAFLNTASCRSAITFIDGDKGILRYRGFPIEQLAEKASFLETAYLLFEGSCPPGPSSTSGRTTSGTTPTSTPTSSSSSRASATTPTQWAPCWAPWALSPRSTPTPSTSMTRPTATCSASG